MHCIGSVMVASHIKGGGDTKSSRKKGKIKQID